MYNLLKVAEPFMIEKELMDTKYPLSRSGARILLEELKKQVHDLDNREDKFDILKQNLDEFAVKYLSTSKSEIITMKYCKNEYEKEAYRVHLDNNRLCYYKNNKYIPIDSTKIFMDFFDGRTPEEDEKYLETMGIAMLPGRIGKSNFSCFVIDKNNDMYINPYRSDTMQHTFTTRGEDILCAGLVLLKNGIIHYVDNTSGHYRPAVEKIELFFSFLKNNSKNQDIRGYFDKGFFAKREKFSWPLNKLVERNETGLDFCHVFDRDKTLEEIEKEKRIRTKIYKKYGLYPQKGLGL